jgi:hypothetical protein
VIDLVSGRMDDGMSGNIRICDVNVNSAGLYSLDMELHTRS